MRLSQSDTIYLTLKHKIIPIDNFLLEIFRNPFHSMTGAASHSSTKIRLDAGMEEEVRRIV